MIVLGILLAITGLLLTLAFVFALLKCREKTEATVSKLVVKNITLRGSTVKQYTPVFTYTVGTNEYSAKADFSTIKPDKFTVGQKVTVHVNAKNPAEMRFGGNVRIIILGAVLLAAGILVLVLGA